MYIVLGLGISSKAVVKKLKELNKDYLIVLKKEEIKKYNNDYDNIISYEMIKYLDLSKVKYVIKSPGIPQYDKYIRYLKSKHVKIINEIEFTYLLTKKLGKYIAISGSVGKSSTVSLLYNLIKSKNDNVILAGNIGDPLINYLDKINKDTIIILEVSSFQLDDFQNIRFHYALLLNIYDNHLDIYKKKEDYYKSKFKLTNNQTKKDYFIVNLDDPITKKYLNNHCFKSILVDYKTGFSVSNNYLYYYRVKILNLNDYNLLGKHNLDNLKAIITILTILNIEIDENVIKRFKGLDYHLQEIKVNNLTIVNDSKSTCSSSLKAAIETYKDRTKILLFGGYNKNLDFSFINDYRFKYVICFGELSHQISKYVKYDIKFNTLKEASNFAFKIANKQDVVLFSPGCASFDEFENYKKRGEAFNRYLKDFYND